MRNKQIYYGGKVYKNDNAKHYLCSSEPCLWLEPTGWNKYNEAFYVSAHDCFVKVRGKLVPFLTWERLEIEKLWEVEVTVAGIEETVYAGTSYSKAFKVYDTQANTLKERATVGVVHLTHAKGSPYMQYEFFAPYKDA